MEFKAIKVSKGAKIRNRYNQVPHLTQDTDGKITNSQVDTTNESQESKSNMLSLATALTKNLVEVYWYWESVFSNILEL